MHLWEPEQGRLDADAPSDARRQPSKAVLGKLVFEHAF